MDVAAAADTELLAKARSVVGHARRIAHRLAGNRLIRVLKNLDNGLFSVPDGDMAALQESLWLRNIAKNAHGDQLDDLSVAEQLFDWTVRNIQLIEDPPRRRPCRPIPTRLAEILLLGRGTVRERAWIFLLLLRQQGLDGVMLAIPASTAADGPGNAKGPAATDKAKDDDGAAKDGRWQAVRRPGAIG